MGDSWEWRRIAWLLLKPALVAAIVALLVALGVTGLRQSWQQGEDAQLGVMGTTHLSGPLHVTGGIQTGNNFTMSAGSLINSSGGITITDDVLLHGGSIADVTGAVTVADSLRVDSQVSASNGIAVTGNVTVTGAGSFSSQLTASNGLSAGGNVTTSTGSLVNSRGAVTVTDQLDVSSQITARNGVAVTGNITASGGLTVTGWGGFYGLQVMPAQTLVVTTNVQITVGNYSLVFIESGATDTGFGIVLDGTACIGDGTYIGQLLIVVNADADGNGYTLHCGKNLVCGTDLSLGYLGAAEWFVWNGTDWIAISPANA